MTTKTCSRCHRVKPLESFHKQSARKNGHKAACKDCECARARAHYQNHKDYYTKYAQDYMRRPGVRARTTARENAQRRTVPERIIFGLAKRRAKCNNVPFSLEKSDIVVHTVCPVFGTPMSYQPDPTRRQHDGSPTLDRIDPGRGYVKGNVCVISWRANRIKSDATLAEIEAIARYMKAAL